MRVLGIDFGIKKIGLALSDERARLAFPLSIIPHDADAVEYITALAREHRVHTIVVGLPVSFDGHEYEMAKNARTFGTHLQKVSGLTVLYENELLTSRLARASKSAQLPKSHRVSRPARRRAPERTGAVATPKRAFVPRRGADDSAAALMLQSYLDRRLRSR